jgi:hypothetical protein
VYKRQDNLKTIIRSHRFKVTELLQIRIKQLIDNYKEYYALMTITNLLTVREYLISIFSILHKKIRIIGLNKLNKIGKLNNKISPDKIKIINIIQNLFFLLSYSRKFYILKNNMFNKIKMQRRIFDFPEKNDIISIFANVIDFSKYVSSDNENVDDFKETSHASYVEFLNQNEKCFRQAISNKNIYFNKNILKPEYYEIIVEHFINNMFDLREVFLFNKNQNYELLSLDKLQKFNK